ncbi:MAG: porin family protein [Rikenellaceae bacterium]
MKKLLLMCAALMICAVSASKAQDYKVLNFGVKLGVNMTSLSGLSDLEASLEAGFTGGLYFEFRPAKVFGLSAEALYSGHSYDSEFYTGDKNVSFTAKLGYIDVPILAKVYLWQGFSVNAGIMPSFLVSSTLQIGNVDEDKSLLDLNKAAFAIPVGLAYNFSWGLMLDARYNIACTRIGADDEIGTAKTSTFTFLVGWRF